jgi:3-carboxy-cis,cis-muconate cycloisomerase
LPSDRRSFDVGLLTPVATGADDLVSDHAIAEALVTTELALTAALEEIGIAPAGAAERLSAALDGFSVDAAAIADRARAGGNPVIPLLADLRHHVDDEETAHWLHRGATSQDILDSALLLVLHSARAAVLDDLDTVAAALARLADEHRGTLAVGRTLTQHSTPLTFGVRCATWLTAVLDARDALAAVALPASLAGASGTLASFVAMGGAERAHALPAAFAAHLGLDAPAQPWHVARRPITALGDALAATTDALGLIAGMVALLSRPELAELAEPAAPGRGGSSTMPQKRNPVLSVLVRSAALRAPGLAAQLHLSAALAIDERPDGAWHAEWPVLRELARLALGAARTAAELVPGIHVDVERMRQTLDGAGDGPLAERRALTGEAGTAEDYLGAHDALIDAAIARQARS